MESVAGCGISDRRTAEARRSWFVRQNRGAGCGVCVHLTCLCADALAAHLGARELRVQSFALHFEHRLRVDTSEQVDQRGNHAGPTGLVAGAQARSVVAVEVLVEEDQVAPVRILLKRFRTAVDGAVALRIAKEDCAETPR